MSKDSTPDEELRSLNAILRTKSLTSMLLPVVLPLFFLALIAFIGINFYTSHKTLFATPKKDSAFDIVKQLRDNPELAVLDVTIEKLAVYSSEHQNNSFDFSAWLTNKKQFCSIPVEVNLKFGYDLSELSANDITIDDSDEAHKSIEIRLPKPQLISSGYSVTYYIKNTTKKPFCKEDKGWILEKSSQVGHGLKEMIRYQAYQDVLAEDWMPIFGKDVQKSTELFFTSLLQNLGYQTVIITRKS